MDRPKAAFFDIDHTVISGSSGRHFLTAAFRKKIIPFGMICSIPFYYFQYRFLHPSWENWTKKFPGFADIDENTVRTISLESFEKYKKSIFPEIEAVISAHKKEGCPVIFATSSVDIFVEPFMAYFKADDLIASSLEFINGKTTGGFKGEPAFGKEKLKRVQQRVTEMGLTLEDCAFYSDSIHDRPLLEHAGFPFAVNPDRRLRKLAKEKNWPVIEPRKK